MKRILPPLAVLATVGANVAVAQISYSGGTYSETFDGIYGVNGNGMTMANVGAVGAQDAIPTLPNWQAARVAGSGTGTFALFGDNGSSNTGRLYSYGGISLSDRALGSLGSGTTVPGFGAAFLNASADTYTSIAISYDREVWRCQNTDGVVDTLSFAYGFASGGIASSGFLTSGSMTPFTALDAISPVEFVNTTATPNVDGNSAPYQQNVVATITGLSWAPGDTLYIRWNDVNNVGSDAGVAIDNLNLTAAVPEPSSMLLMGLGVVALAVLRRKTR